MSRFDRVIGVLTALLLGFSGQSCSRDSTGGASPEPEPCPETIFATILDLHRKALEKDRSPGQCHSDHPTRAMIEFRYHVVEARLWTRCFPDQAARIAFPLAKDESANLDDRDLAIRVLGFLVGLENRAAEALLLELVQSGSSHVAAQATWILSKEDRQGRFRKQYCERALRDDQFATDLLGDWADADSKEVLEQITQHQQFEMRATASTSLRRIGWLERPDWASRVASILESRHGTTYLDFDWALRIARQGSLPGLVDLLRNRLREVEVEHAEFCRRAFEEGYDTERDFAKTFQIAALDWYFDDLLKVYAEIGGSLTVLEQQRLYTLGYGTDPRKHLFEFVAAWK
jgi:hypothetical protein